jgi:hypothetical protein
MNSPYLCGPKTGIFACKGHILPFQTLLQRMFSTQTDFYKNTP